MNDIRTLWELCDHGHAKPHIQLSDPTTGEPCYFSDCWTAHSQILCEGGKEIVFCLEHRCTCLMHEDIKPDDWSHNSWCRIKDDLWVETS